MTAQRYRYGIILAICVAACRGQFDLAPAQPNPDNAQPTRSCSAPGQICATCDAVSVCIGNGDGSLTTITQACDQTEHCVGGQCVQGALCNYRPFQCSEEGFFPDPYDCTKYHVCVTGLDALNFQCSTGSSYNALSASCGYPLNTTACVDRPVPECTKRLEIGPVAGNPNLYYICVEKDGTLAPELHKCSSGLPFNAGKLSCITEEPKAPKGKKSKKKGKGE